MFCKALHAYRAVSVGVEFGNVEVEAEDTALVEALADEDDAVPDKR